MKYNFKKIFAGVLAVLSVNAFIPEAAYSPLCDNSSIIASAAEIAQGECGSALKWSLDEQGILKITGGGTAMYDYASDSYAPWYKYRNDIKTLLFDADNLNYIGNYAFYGCAFESLDFSKSLSFGKSCFENCTMLKSIILPKKLTKTSESLFSGCVKLEDVTLPYGMTSIGSNTFLNCTNLKEIRIPESVSEISDCAFKDCASLSQIDLPNELKKISRNAFDGCTALNSICIPENSDVDSSSFDNCTGLTHIFINGLSVKTFSHGTFKGWGKAIYHVPSAMLDDYQNSPSWSEIKNKITSWPSVTFDGGGVIENSTFLSGLDYTIKPYLPNAPKGAQFLGWFTDKNFEESFNLTSTISSDCTLYSKWHFGGECGNGLNWTIDDDGVLTISGEGDEMAAFNTASDAPWSELKKLIRSVEITAPNLKSISSKAFYMSQNLESVTIENVLNIEDSAFSGCPNLKTIILNCKTDSIAATAFQNCSSLENISVPSGTVEYYTYALSAYSKKINAVPAVLSGYHLSVNGDITINFYADIVDMARLENGEMRFTLGGAAAPAVPVNKAAKSADNKYYIFPVSIPAKNMYDKINAQFYVDGKSVSQVYHFSIFDYADALKSDFVSYTDFVDALLEYGCQAAAYFDIKSAPSPKNSQYAYADILSALNDYSTLPAMNPSYVGTSLLLKSKLILRNYYSTNISGTTQSLLNPSLYYAETDFSPAQFGKKLDNCCVYNYIYRVLKSDETSVKLKNVCSSLYNLSQAFLKMNNNK